ncbi:MAG: NADP-dependent isocitrate dehydrogenase [Elusimicrobiota bacterium]
MSSPRKVTVIPGDGVGPEIVKATQRIIQAVGVPIQWDEQHAGLSVFKGGLQSGVPASTIESIKQTRVVLKGPLETPIGFGEKSANVTLRKLFETYANIRPVREFPGVKTPYSGRNIDIVVVRENVEDLYAGIEHMQTPGVAQCLKVMSDKGCERIVRTAFELARAEGRKKVHCATKSNIMKFTEGFLKKKFEEVAKDYPEIEANHIIIDNCAHQLVKKPEQFDVIVTSNMNGDIISDLTSALVGGLGFAPSANLGNEVAIFEAVHGSAPKYTGKNIINPCAVILSATMMLRFLKEFDAAAKIENAIFVTLENGKHQLKDFAEGGPMVTSDQFTDEVIKNLGKTPKSVQTRSYKAVQLPGKMKTLSSSDVKTRIVGIDVFVESKVGSEALGKGLEDVASLGGPLKLKIISNPGTKVYPTTGAMTDSADQFFRCRFILKDANGQLTDADLLTFLGNLSQKFSWMHVEKLFEFNGVSGFTKSHGED